MTPKIPAASRFRAKTPQKSSEIFLFPLKNNGPQAPRFVFNFRKRFSLFGEPTKTKTKPKKKKKDREFDAHRMIGSATDGADLARGLWIVVVRIGIGAVGPRIKRRHCRVARTGGIGMVNSEEELVLLPGSLVVVVVVIVVGVDGRGGGGGSRVAASGGAAGVEEMRVLLLLEEALLEIEEGRTALLLLGGLVVRNRHRRF